MAAPARARTRRPRRFTELVQWRKLHDRDPPFPRLIDEVAVKAFVRDKIDVDWVTPTHWRRGAAALARLASAVCGQVAARLQPTALRVEAGHDWFETQRAGARWTRRAYGNWLAEWDYAGVPRGILVEPFIGVGRVLPIDYKLFVFHGRVAAVQVHLDRATDHRWILLDRNWRSLSRQVETPRRPRSLDAMIAAAEELARGFAFVRIDLFDAKPHPRFGKMTFYPGSGLDPFASRGVDEWPGSLWRGAPQGSAITASRRSCHRAMQPARPIPQIPAEQLLGSIHKPWFEGAGLLLLHRTLAQLQHRSSFGVSPLSPIP